MKKVDTQYVVWGVIDKTVLDFRTVKKSHEKILPHSLGITKKLQEVVRKFLLLYRFYTLFTPLIFLGMAFCWWDFQYRTYR